MTNPYYAPEFQFQINDAPIPAALRASMSSVTLKNGLEGADRVDLSLANENLRWLDDPLLALDNTLRLSIGYAPDTLQQVFVGEIVTHSASFPSGGLPTLTVGAQDRFEHLKRGKKLRWFATPALGGNLPLLDTTIAGQISLENGFVPIIDPVGAALAVLLGGAETVVALADGGVGGLQNMIRLQDNESDYVFLERVAVENGWEMFIEHGGPLGGHQLRFMSPMDRLEPEVTLKYGRSLIDFTPRISNVGQIVSVTAYVWVAPMKTQFTVCAGWDWDQMALTVDIRPEFVPTAAGPSDYVIDRPLTPVSAPREIINKLIPRLNARLTGSGSTVGDPRIRAGAVLRLEGLGAQFGGLYRVTTATHTIDSSGYRTQFEARKEIWFGSIPLPEQGAVPVKAPFVG